MSLLKLILFATLLQAGPSATLMGRVTDTAGTTMTAVTVDAINVETGIKLSTETNDEGLYSITNLPPGIYRLVLQKHGFKLIVKPGLELHVQDILALNFEMQIGSTAESVTVEEGAPLIQAETATLGQTIDTNLIDELPNRPRNPYLFIRLNPGAVVFSQQPDPYGPANPLGLGLSLNGQRPESGNFILDGADANTNPATTAPGQALPDDAVREYRILTNAYTAEYGRNIGFVSSLVTKSGTNEFHGSLYNSFHNSALSANSFDYNARGLEKTAYNQQRVGGALGGPIIAEKSFFFGALESFFARGSEIRSLVAPTAELLSISSPQTRAAFSQYQLPRDLYNVSTQSVQPYGSSGTVRIPAFGRVSVKGQVSGIGGRPQNTVLGLARVDYALSRRTLLTSRYAFQNMEELARVLQSFTSKLDQPVLTRNHNATLNVTHVWSAGLATEVRVGFNRLSTTRPETGPNPFLRPGVLDSTGSLPAGLPRRGGPRNLYPLHQTVSWIRRNHNFKFGADFVHYRDSIATSLYPALWRPPTDVRGFVNGRMNTLTVPFDFLANGLLQPGDSLDGRLLSPNRAWHGRYTDVAWFVQDTWKITRRFTLTPGLRWEYFGVQSSPGDEKVRDVNFYLGDGRTYWERFANGQFQRTADAPGSYRGHFTRPDRNNFGPRLGLVFDLTGDGKTIFRAGGGIFFDATYGRVPPAIIGAVRFLDVPFAPEMPDNPYAINGRGSSAPPWVERIDPDRRTPYSSAWNATVEREVGGKAVLSASYVGSSTSALELVTAENGEGSGRFVGRPGDRLLNNYDVFLTVKSQGHSSYHSLQLKAESRRIHRLGFLFGANYAWSHSLDNASDRFIDQEREEFISVGYLPGARPVLDPLNPGLNRGSSSFDRRQRFATYFIWEIPAIRSRWGPMKHLTGGWQMSGTLFFFTGSPIFVVDGWALDDDYHVTRPRVTGPLPRVLSAKEMVPDPRAPNTFVYLQPNVFRNVDGTCVPDAAPFACVNSIYDRPENLLGRNHYTGPGGHSESIALTKTVRLRETTRLRIRAEFYNPLNHSNLEMASLGPHYLNRVVENRVVSGVLVRRESRPRQIVLYAKIVF